MNRMNCIVFMCAFSVTFANAVLEIQDVGELKQTSIHSAALDCNYASFPEFCIKNATLNVTLACPALRYAAPIGVCATAHFSAPLVSASIISYTFECDSNSELLINLWMDADTCDDSTPFITTTAYSEDYNCDGTSACDYVGVEYYPLDPNEPCTDGIDPSYVTPGYIPYVVDACFSSDKFDESIFISDDCYSSANIVVESYPQTGCAGTPDERTIPSSGICEQDVYSRTECPLCCSIETTTPISTDSGSDSYEIINGDSREDMSLAVANGEEKETRAEDERHYNNYTINVKLSDAALMNMYGLFGVLAVVNILFWCLCHQRKRHQKSVLQLQGEDALD
eukprot:261051_1